jgi:hypothetical protein
LKRSWCEACFISKYFNLKSVYLPFGTSRKQAFFGITRFASDPPGWLKINGFQDRRIFVKRFEVCGTGRRAQGAGHRARAKGKNLK